MWRMNKHDDWQPFCALMRSASRMTATEPKTEDALGLMFTILQKYELQEIQEAVLKHFKTSQGMFFPMPANIISLIEGSPEEKANIAWRFVEKVMTKYDSRDSVRFPRPEYHYAIEILGGWKKFSDDFNELSDKDLIFFGKRFEETYLRALRTGQDWEKVRPYFKGEFEAHNLAGGYSEFIPKVIEVATGRELSQDDEILRIGRGRNKDFTLRQLMDKRDEEGAE